MSAKRIISNFTKIHPDRFIEFHKEFKGDGSWWQVCADCGGECENHKIGSLMPGEKEYVARVMGLSPGVFREKYLDSVETPAGNIEVLKLKPGCPFLNPDYHCIIQRTKVVLCDVYPLAFEVNGGEVQFYLDPECPLSQNKEVAHYFEQVGIPALKKLDAPVEWYRAVASFDSFSINYEEIQNKRTDVSKFETFTLEQLIAARI